ncbi:MAG: site-specific integrase, partial [Candidatus Omnitrophica bacterium]|nr:site-specific integrase [Candidatus Omnitrophota bacterium]
MKRFIWKFMNYLEVERNYSRHTLRSYRSDLLELASFLKDRRPGEVTHVDLRLFMANLKKRNCSRRTIVRKIAAVKSFFKFLVREKLVMANPADSVFTPKLDKRLPEFLDQAKILELITAPVKDDITGLRDRAILEVLYSTGIRVSELAGLDNADVDLVSGVIKVRGKGKKERIALLGEEAQRAVRDYLRKRQAAGK